MQNPPETPTRAELGSRAVMLALLAMSSHTLTINGLQTGRFVTNVLVDQEC